MISLSLLKTISHVARYVTLMRNTQRCLSTTLALSLLLSPVCVVFADDTPPAATVPQTKTSETQTPQQVPLEKVAAAQQIDTPVSVDTSLDVKPVQQERMEEQLSALIEAQQKMAAQIDALKTDLQKTNARGRKVAKKLLTTARTVNTQQSSIDNLLKRVRVGGYVEHGWRHYTNAPNTSEYLGAAGAGEFDEDGNSFDNRRLVIRTNVQFTERASWIGEIEYEDAGTDGISVEQSEFLYNYKPWLNVRAGIIIPTLSQINVNHEGTSRLLVDRPLVDQFIVPSTYRDLGVGAWGFVPVGKKSALNYEVNILNGFSDLLKTSDSVVASGAPLSSNRFFNGLRNARPHRGANNGHFRDNNDNKAVHSRVGFVPFPGMEVGVGGYWSKYDRHNDKTLQIYTADVRYRRKKFSFLGEFAQVFFERGAGTNRDGVLFNQYPGGMWGYHLQAAYDISPKVTGVMAWQQANLDTKNNGNIISRASIGARFNPFSRVYLKGEYQLTIPRRDFRNSQFSHGIITQLTFDL